MNIYKAALLAVFCLISSLAIADTITFDGFTGTFPYSENGFTFTLLSLQADASVHVQPNQIEVGISITSNNVPAQTTIEITYQNNGLFSLNSLSYEGAPEYWNCVFTGLSNNATQFNFVGYGSSSQSPFLSTITAPSLQIDTLLINISLSHENNNSVEIDNIDIQAVPEPASLSLIGTALLGYAACRKFFPLKR